MAMEVNQVYQMDALELLRTLEPQSVDAIITDLPYGTTGCDWDTVIPFAPMWEAVKRALKPRGVFVTTASQPFTSALVASNFAMFKYSWIWVKDGATGFPHAANMPMKDYEDVCVFSSGAIGHAHLVSNRMTYNPQGLVPYGKEKHHTNRGFEGKMERASQKDIYVTEFTNYPHMVQRFPSEQRTVHPTQKPVEMYAYLIRTYTQPNDLVVDMCCGSGTTAAACIATGRHYIVGDSDPHYCEVTRLRLQHTSKQELAAALQGKPVTTPMFTD